MGLDIYLKWFDNHEETMEAEREYERLSEENWDGNQEDGKYDKLSEEQKESYRKKDKEIAAQLGLNSWGSAEEGDKMKSIEFDCKRYPDHYFKVGYFRSSYNAGGIEKILRNLGLDTLHDIFNYERGSEEYYFQPNWERSLEKVKKVIEEFKKTSPIRCYEESSNIFKEPNIKSEADAIKAYMNQQEQFNKREDKSFDSYGNSEGTFYMGEPLKVKAMIPGKSNLLGERDCVYIITESDNEWYIQALEIVQETIEYVLSKKDKEKYYLTWSG